MKKTLSILLGLVCLSSVAFSQSVSADYAKIQNDCFWHDTAGKPIFSQGGGIFRFPDAKTGETLYFWYGVRYREAPLYYADQSVTQARSTMEGVDCYVSRNLVDWEFRGTVLTREEMFRDYGMGFWGGRMGVAYLPQTRQYAIAIQFQAQKGSGVMFATCDTPDGNYVQNNLITVTDYTGLPTTGDQTVFTDEDTGKSYLVYSYGKGRNKIYVSEIGIKNGKVDLLDCERIFIGAGREGNCMFKHNGKFYMSASDLYGWDGSHAYYLVADNIYGPYLPTNEMKVMPGCTSDYAHVSQTGFYVTVRGSKEETVIYCGDRWSDFAGNGKGYNVWVPLSFEGDVPVFNSLSSWYLNERTGEWKVAEDNNWITNGSFEADRRLVPEPEKPRQDQLMGWKTTVISGNKVENDNPNSPKINFDNTKEDRMVVVGEKSLLITDSKAFIREVEQKIGIGGHAADLVEGKGIALPDGRYELAMMVKGSGVFKSLTVSLSARKSFKMELKPSAEWQKVTIPVKIKGGRATLLIHAEGEADASCRIDDVTLIRK